ncbi:MAG TPA: IS1 family transposase [Chloroflexi bacterium]|nr:IS1 family transposase [Chloroflexota bacterium]
MNQIVNTGDFCPNQTCPDYGKLQGEQSKRNIKKYGRTRNGTQRFQCKSCGRTFTATKGTIFYRRRTPMPEILEVLALTAEGTRISTPARIKGHKEDTILNWLEEAGNHTSLYRSSIAGQLPIGAGTIGCSVVLCRQQR